MIAVIKPPMPAMTFPIGACDCMAARWNGRPSRSCLDPFLAPLDGQEGRRVTGLRP